MRKRGSNGYPARAHSDVRFMFSSQSKTSRFPLMYLQDTFQRMRSLLPAPPWKQHKTLAGEQVACTRKVKPPATPLRDTVCKIVPEAFPIVSVEILLFGRKRDQKFLTKSLGFRLRQRKQDACFLWWRWKSKRKARQFSVTCLSLGTVTSMPSYIFTILLFKFIINGFGLCQ